MTVRLGIRREDKNKWEQRTPIIPEHIKGLFTNHNIETVLQPSPIRAFSDEEYKNEGAIINEDLSSCKVVFAVKEIPKDLFELEKTYVFFSHVIKGQDYNMPMLKEMMNKKCNLIDYEKIVNKKNIRLIFFGRYAGISGMVDTLYTFGQRLKQYYKVNTAFEHIKKTYEYQDLAHLKDQISEIGDEIKEQGIPDEFSPLIIGFAGYGNVSRGAQEILDLLPCKEIQPNEIETILDNPSNKIVYKVVFKEKDMVKPIEPNDQFELQDYYKNPEKYTSDFEQYLPHLSVLMNCIYWDERYPRLLTKSYVKKHHNNKDFRPAVIGDISVDIDGAIEPTGKVTTPDNPAYVYDPHSDLLNESVTADGVAIMAVDNLPCELPKESSTEFSNALLPFIPGILKADYAKSFDELDLPFEVKNAVILHKGKLTPAYEYINNYL